MSDYGLVSIIMPAFNCERYIEESIESVLSQSYNHWELLIQDDCSSDETFAIASRYAAQDERIRVERNTENSGAAVTRNNAIARSCGVFLAFLDSDDVWLPSKLDHQLDFMNTNGCDFSFTRYRHIDETGASLGLVTRVKQHLTYRQLLMHCWPGCLTVVYKQDPQHKIYGPNIKKNNDHALFLRVMRDCHCAMGLDSIEALYRIRKGSISRNKLKLISPYYTVVHKFEHKNTIFSIFCVITHVVIKVFFKYERNEIR